MKTIKVFLKWFRSLKEKCNSKVYKRGKVIFLTDSIPSEKIEEFVISVRKDSGQRVDWHYMGGRAVIKYLGDKNKVIESLKKFRNIHDEAYEKMMIESPVPTTKEYITKRINGYWDMLK